MQGRLLIFGLILALAGCDRIPLPTLDLFSGTVPQEPLPYRARLQRDGRLDPNFTVTVDARGAGLAQVRESVRYPGTRYCLATFGTSGIDWLDRGAPDDWVATPTGSGRLAFRGRCDFR